MDNLNQPINPNKLSHLHIIVVTVIIIFTGLLIILIVNVFSMSKEIYEVDSASWQTNTDLKEYLEATYTPDMKELIEGENSPWMGTEDAEIVIVGFNDFACPFCKQASSIMRQLDAKYGNRIKIIFRNRPAYDNSIALTMTAHCAGEQDKFWEMHDKLYQNQSESLGSDTNVLANLAMQIGLDIGPLAICANEERYLDQIQLDFITAESLEVEGTPTWFINGQKTQGVLTLAEWEAILIQLID